MLFPLSTGQSLILHLRMTGTPYIRHAPAEPDKHTHAILVLEDDLSLHYHDVRKFGRFYLVDDASDIFSKLGPEPLGDEFSAADIMLTYGLNIASHLGYVDDETPRARAYCERAMARPAFQRAAAV